MGTEEIWISREEWRERAEKAESLVVRFKLARYAERALEAEMALADAKAQRDRWADRHTVLSMENGELEAQLAAAREAVRTSFMTCVSDGTVVLRFPTLASAQAAHGVFAALASAAPEETP